MFIVFRIYNGDIRNKELVAICSDYDIANNYIQLLINDDVGHNDVMYVIGGLDDI